MYKTAKFDIQPNQVRRQYSFHKSSNIELVVKNAAIQATIWLGGFIFIAAIELAQFFLTPIFIAIIIGILLSPVANVLETKNIRPAISSAFAVLLLIIVISSTLAGLAVPLTEWADKLSFIWFRINNLPTS